MDLKGKDYDHLTREELEKELREAFLDSAVIDDPMNEKLEKLRETLDRKWPVTYLYSPEESWEHFLGEYGEELSPYFGEPEETEEVPPPENSKKRKPRLRALFRWAAAAAVILVLLAGVVLAAGPRLRVWVRGWNAAQDTPVGTENAGGPIPAALEELGITEPVYPAWLPSDFLLTEAHVSEDPLLLYELYTKGDRFFSITITPVSAVEKAMYPQMDRSTEEYRVGENAHYLFSNSGSVTAVWYTEHYFISVNGNITARAMKRVIDSAYGR